MMTVGEAANGAGRLLNPWRARVGAGRSETAPPSCSWFFGLSSRRRVRASRGLDKPAGVMQPAEDRRAHDLRAVRQAMPVGLGLDGQAFRLWCAKNESGRFGRLDGGRD